MACENQFAKSESNDVELMEQYYDQHTNSTDYNLNLNFFYGDEGTKDLNFPSYGIPVNGGFCFAKYVADERRKSSLLTV